jgi:hypothetical protein
MGGIGRRIGLANITSHNLSGVDFSRGTHLYLRNEEKRLHIAQLGRILQFTLAETSIS